MNNTNNVSQNRGSEVINQLTDYSYNVNMYEEIRHYYNTEKYTVFPQVIHKGHTVVVTYRTVSVTS